MWRQSTGFPNFGHWGFGPHNENPLWILAKAGTHDELRVRTIELIPEFVKFLIEETERYFEQIFATKIDMSKYFTEILNDNAYKISSHKPEAEELRNSQSVATFKKCFEDELKNKVCAELLERDGYKELARHIRNKDIDLINQCMYTQGILSGAQIVEEMAKGNIVITDFDPKRLNPNSYNVRLANELLVYDLKPGEYLDMKKKNPTKVIDLNDFPDGYVLQPGVLYLGSTMETAGCKHHLVPMMAGRSSIARLGMGSDYFAAFGDVGFGSKAGVKWTYEITVIHPLKIYAGIDIAQVYFLTLAGKELSNYNETGKYANNNGVEASKLYDDFENK